MRIAITGGPGTGKTTLGKELAIQHGLPYFSTDDVMDLGWSGGSLAASQWFNEPNFVIEGVAVPRALRKWQATNPGKSAPVDQVIKLNTVHRDIPAGAVAMAKGVETVLDEIRPWLGVIDERE